jgi:hypothetical protein
MMDIMECKTWEEYEARPDKSQLLAWHPHRGWFVIPKEKFDVGAERASRGDWPDWVGSIINTPSLFPRR